MSVYSDTNREIGDGQRGQDQHYEYPKMLVKGLDHVIVDDLDGELTAIDAGYSTGVSAKSDAKSEEIARLRAELAAATGGEVKRGPGRPPRQINE